VEDEKVYFVKEKYKEQKENHGFLEQELTKGTLRRQIQISFA
jgi:hypothetical protein